MKADCQPEPGRKEKLRMIWVSPEWQLKESLLLFVILASIHSSDTKISTDGSWGYETLHVTGETKEEHQ